MSDAADTIARAAALAFSAHAGQVDKQGSPYFAHVAAVAARVARRGGTPEQIAAAYLHDTIEDAGLTRVKLIKEVGPDVAQIVDALSRCDSESYDEYIARLKEHPNALLVKACDLEDNLDTTRGPIPGNLAARYSVARTVIESAIHHASV